MDLKKLKEILKEKGEPEYRFDQIYQAVFKDLCFDFEKIYGLPKRLRQELKEKIRPFSLELGKLKKTEGVKKALFKLEDGLFIETVLMRHKYGRKTVCVSSMVGCPLACRFCATGQMGFLRNLNWQEIVDQILFFAQKEKNRKLNVVFMGMGEPFLNYTQVLKAIRVLNDKKGFGLGARAMSVSTAGIIPGIQKFQNEGLEVNLAISLNSPDEEQRSYLMPVNRKYPLKKLLSVARSYTRATKRKLFFEYIMLKGVNDDLVSAKKLAGFLIPLRENPRANPPSPSGFGRTGSPRLDKIIRESDDFRFGGISALKSGKELSTKRKIRGLKTLGASKGEPLFHINLIKYNDTKTEFKSSDEETTLLFQKELEKRGLRSTIRHSFGGEIRAACGQLAVREVEEK